ncbi:MAG TPA: hypothetical protein VMS81_04190, partial [Methanomicrobiales archaeon]|nr:hypothetical protein [Methanomicrobiales archaeon]
VLICVVLVINLAARGVIYLGMNSRGGSSFVSHLDRLLSMRRIDRVVEPVGSSRDDETNCPLQELEREEGERLMAKGKERPQGKWGQRP